MSETSEKNKKLDDEEKTTFEFKENAKEEQKVIEHDDMRSQQRQFSFAAIIKRLIHVLIAPIRFVQNLVFNKSEDKSAIQTLKSESSSVPEIKWQPQGDNKQKLNVPEVKSLKYESANDDESGQSTDDNDKNNLSVDDSGSEVAKHEIESSGDKESNKVKSEDISSVDIEAEKNIDTKENELTSGEVQNKLEEDKVKAEESKADNKEESLSKTSSESSKLTEDTSIDAAPIPPSPPPPPPPPGSIAPPPPPSPPPPPLSTTAPAKDSSGNGKWGNILNKGSSGSTPSKVNSAKNGEGVVNPQEELKKKLAEISKKTNEKKSEKQSTSEGTKTKQPQAEVPKQQEKQVWNNIKIPKKEGKKDNENVDTATESEMGEAQKMAKKIKEKSKSAQIKLNKQADAKESDLNDQKSNKQGLDPSEMKITDKMKVYGQKNKG